MELVKGHPAIDRDIEGLIIHESAHVSQYQTAYAKTVINDFSDLTKSQEDLDKEDILSNSANKKFTNMHNEAKAEVLAEKFVRDKYGKAYNSDNKDVSNSTIDKWHEEFKKNGFYSK